VRGNETDESGRLKMGRAGWFDEVMRFYDRFLKGVEPSTEDPMVTVHGGSITLPFLATARTVTINGAPGTQLPSYLARRVTVPASTLQSSTSSDFSLPPRMK
jgi:hypothetical protein